jgi:hypothetical protein
MEYNGVKTKSDIEETDTKRLEDQNNLNPTPDEGDSMMSN